LSAAGAQNDSQSRTAGWRTAAIIILAGAVVLAMNMGLRQTFGLFIEPITLELDISRSNFSLAIAVQNLLWGLLTPFFGVLADRFGAGRSVALGGLLYGLGILLMALGDSAAALHIGNGLFVGTAVAACGYPLVLSAVARAVSEKQRAMALSLAATGGSVGQFVLLPLTQAMIEFIGWQNALLVLAGLGFLVVPLAVVLVGKPAADPGHSESGPQASIRGALKQALGHRGYWLLNAGFFVCGFHVSFIATHLPGYIVTCHLPAFVGATALGVIGFFNILGGLATGPLGSRYRKKYLLSGIYLGRAATIAAFMLGPKTEVTVLAFSAAFGLLWLSTVPLTSGLVGDIFGPRYMATLYGVVLFSHQVGAFFGAWLGGLNFDATGNYNIVWGISVLLGLLAALLHWPIPDTRVTAPSAAKA
jgi:predicted MFS family arabinose efflux permease